MNIRKEPICLEKDIFTTRNDLLPEFRKIENLIDLQYIFSDRTQDINIPTYDHFGDIPLDDNANMSGIYTMTNPYMIIPKGATYHFSTIHRTDKPGVTEYKVEMNNNLEYLTCSFGGWYKHNDELVYIAGLIGTFHNATQNAKELYKPFSRRFCNSFVTLKDWRDWPWKVGPEALEILRSGTRFITDHFPEQSQHSHDLVLPPELK